jgi:hypothetical protein
MTGKPRVLLVGIDPAAIDYSKPGMLQGMTADVVRAYLDTAHRSFAGSGIDADMCLIGFEESEAEKVARNLSTNSYDVVVIGAGLRAPDETVRLLENVLEAVRNHAPRARIAFNTNPMDSLEAAKRVI